MIEKLKMIDWSQPVTILIVALIVLAPTVGGHYLQVGLVLGLIQALGILVLLRKAPQLLQDFVAAHAFLSDLVLSALSTIALSQLYGHGLVLGIGAITCALLLSWALPRQTDP